MQVCGYERASKQRLQWHVQSIAGPSPLDESQSQRIRLSPATSPRRSVPVTLFPHRPDAPTGGIRVMKTATTSSASPFHHAYIVHATSPHQIHPHIHRTISTPSNLLTRRPRQPPAASPHDKSKPIATSTRLRSRTQAISTPPPRQMPRFDTSADKYRTPRHPRLPHAPRTQ
jgi:hypothetical protein